MSDESAHGSNQISPERQKILDDIHVQMRKSRANIDASLLTKVKAFIMSHPVLRRSYGVKKPETVLEPIDRAKNIDVIAKFLEQNPDRKGDVAKILKD